MSSVKSKAARILLCGVLATLSMFKGLALPAPVQNEDPHASVDTGTGGSIRIKGSTSPRIATAGDAGSASGSEVLTGITILFKQTSSQAEALHELLIEQQIVGHPNYHRWLSTQEYGARFGLDSERLKAIEHWLAAEGFTNAIVNASHTAVSFDGNVTQAEKSFSTNFHRYAVAGRVVLANSTDLEVPAELSRSIEGVVNTDQLQPMPQTQKARSAASPHWSSAEGGKHFLTPADVKRIYDFAPLTTAGYTGRGQSIAVVGQSAVDPADIARFRAAAGLSARQPSFVLVPHTGTSVRKPGDEFESDADLEYSSAIAPDADIIFVYSGANASHSVFDALGYAIDQNLAPVINISYGQCERTLSKNEVAALERALMQAAVQGQTVLASSGDAGATGCETDPARSSEPATNGLGVQYPASSQYVTSVGGTMFSDAGSSMYWFTGNAADGESAQGYIPEQAWSEVRGTGEALLLASGGGRSAVFPKPVWQSAPGVPQDGARDIPDIALAAGTEHDGYVVCSSDSSLKVQGSCSQGFLDAAGQNLLVAGGTSLGAPIAAGIAVLLDQSNGVSRLGNLNAVLYPLAARAPNAFHDITTGTNKQPCIARSKDCSSDGSEGYSAELGYDQVTGLGTPDVGQIMTALTTAPGESSEPVSMSLKQIGNPQTGTVMHLLAVVSASGGTPEGVVQLSLDGENVGAPLPISSGEARFTIPAPSAGQHTFSAVFTTTAGRLAATSSLAIMIPGTAISSRASFVLSGTSNVSGPSGTASEITVTPVGGYSGRVSFTAATSDPDLLRFGCYRISDVDVAATATAHSTFTVARAAAECKELASSGASVRRFSSPHSASLAGNIGAPARLTNAQEEKRLQGRLVLVSTYGVIFLTNLRRRFRLYSSALLAICSLITTLSGCSVTVVSGDAPPGTYTVLIEGTDTIQPSISATMTVPLRID